MIRKTNLLLAIIFAISITILANHQLDAGSLVAYWSFDEGSGKEVKDQSGTGNDGQVNGAKWVQGKFEEGMQFNGVDNFVLVPNSDTYNFTKDDSFTISLWINYEPKGDWQGPLQKSEIKSAAGGNLPEAGTSVEPSSKLTTTWADIKK